MTFFPTTNRTENPTVISTGIRKALKRVYSSNLFRVVAIIVVLMLLVYAAYSYRSWEKLVFTAGDTEVTFHRKHIHPFLAEYKRQVRFEDNEYRSNSMWLVVNHGGRTAINVYTSDEGILLMDKDYLYLYRSGGTDADIQNSIVTHPEFARGYENELFVDDWLNREEGEYFANIEYVGRIDGTGSELQFVSAEQDVERDFNYSDWE